MSEAALFRFIHHNFWRNLVHHRDVVSWFARATLVAEHYRVTPEGVVPFPDKRVIFWTRPFSSRESTLASVIALQSILPARYLPEYTRRLVVDLAVNSRFSFLWASISGCFALVSSEQTVSIFPSLMTLEVRITLYFAVIFVFVGLSKS